MQFISSPRQMLKIAMLSAIFFCFSVVCGNMSLRYIPVSFNQVSDSTRQTVTISILPLFPFSLSFLSPLPPVLSPSCPLSLLSPLPPVPSPSCPFSLLSPLLSPPPSCPLSLLSPLPSYPHLFLPPAPLPPSPSRFPNPSLPPFSSRNNNTFVPSHTTNPHSFLCQPPPPRAFAACIRTRAVTPLLSPSPPSLLPSSPPPPPPFPFSGQPPSPSRLPLLPSSPHPPPPPPPPPFSRQSVS
ncbi:unnamed protein product [Closterium sp. NIES-64]|nr:unnamed protein product [Closterium sp. NIES-64]